ncbi:MAG: hypothetical protein PVI03_06660 [Candidatus Thorarchaeota archaeon]|jgi:hypothetical protein
MLWILRDLKNAVKQLLRMLRDREFWRIFKESIKEMGANPYG